MGCGNGVAHPPRAQEIACEAAGLPEPLLGRSQAATFPMFAANRESGLATQRRERHKRSERELERERERVRGSERVGERARGQNKHRKQYKRNYRWQDQRAHRKKANEGMRDREAERERWQMSHRTCNRPYWFQSTRLPRPLSLPLFFRDAHQRRPRRRPGPRCAPEEGAPQLRFGNRNCGLADKARTPQRGESAPKTQS
jgi:hypothetical protein